MPNHQLIIAFFLQVATILLVCRLAGHAARALGQPAAIGEMLAGILMGPSLLGLLAPGLSAALFPRETMPVLYIASHLGLALYMFTIGMDIRTDVLAARARAAATISLAGMAVPFALGAGLAGLVHDNRVFFPESVNAASAMLYSGAAMAITAFPMLARILQERGLSGTRVGTLALAAASIDDAAAWCVLSIVLAQLDGHWAPAVLAVGGGLAFVLAVMFVLRPLLARFLVARGDELSAGQLASVLALLMGVSWFTEWIGIYAVFGAFILGAAMPRGAVSRSLSRTIEPLTTGLLVPLFFVYSGLNTRITLLDTPFLWGITGIVLLAACIGKGISCWAAARLHGETPRDSAAIGALMNARGLTELIILNIGLQRGVITGTLFSMLVVMAIVTTLLATPLLGLAMRPRSAAAPAQ